jgi:selenide,water dikinase
LGTSTAIAMHKMMQQGYLDITDVPETASKAIHAAESSMLTDNSLAVEMRKQRLVTACTDITGFGLMGHLSNLINPVGAEARIELSQLPILDGVAGLVEAGIHTHAGDAAQLEYADQQAKVDLLKDPKFHLAFLPETSGGILATVPSWSYERLKNLVEESGQTLAVIGEIATRGLATQDNYRFANIEISQ